MAVPDGFDHPSVRLRHEAGRWVCEAANSGWRRLSSDHDWPLVGEPVGALLTDRFVAEALGRLCDLAILTATRRHLLTTSISGAPRLAEAVPVPAEVPETPVRVVLSLLPSAGAPASLSQMERTLGDAQELVAVFDRSLRVAEVNDAVCLVSGLQREDIVGRTNLDLGYPPALAHIWDGHHRSVFETGEPRVVSYDLPTVLGQRMYESVISPGAEGAGDGPTVVVVSRDVTGEHLDETVARRARAQASEVSAMWRRLDPTPVAAPRARQEVTAWLLDSGLPPSTDVELVTSELVANAAMHAGTFLYLHVRRLGEVVRIEVHDGSSTLPTERQGDGVGGRGLALVRSLSARWGVTPGSGGGKAVWSELRPDNEPDPVDLPVEALLDLWSDADW